MAQNPSNEERPDNSIRHFVGLDLGQAQDWTALAILQRQVVWPTDPPSRRRPTYAVRHLHRFTLGTTYSDVVEHLLQLLRRPRLVGSTLVVDQTGVGQAVVNTLADGLRNQVTCTFFPATLTAGHAFHVGESGQLLVPKKDLVGTLQVLLQGRRLQVASALPDAPMLKRELENFRIRKPTVANDDALAAWREGEHDDLILAIALAAWMGEQALPPLVDPPVERVVGRIVVPC